MRKNKYKIVLLDEDDKFALGETFTSEHAAISHVAALHAAYLYTDTEAKYNYAIKKNGVTYLTFEEFSNDDMCVMFGKGPEHNVVTGFKIKVPNVTFNIKYLPTDVTITQADFEEMVNWNQLVDDEPLGEWP